MDRADNGDNVNRKHLLVYAVTSIINILRYNPAIWLKCFCNEMGDGVEIKTASSARNFLVAFYLYFPDMQLLIHCRLHMQD